jgi:phosphomannomutase
VKPLRAVLDTGNGMGGVGAEAIFKSLPVRTVKLYFELDGTFPNHPPDPLEEANRREIMARVKSERAELGIAWDGGRRPLLLHRRHRRLRARRLRHRAPGRGVLPQGARGALRVRRARLARGARSGGGGGGKALVNRVGHAFFKKRMREEGGVFGGEVSGHFYFRENWFADNGMIPAPASCWRCWGAGARSSAPSWLPCVRGITSAGR